MDTGFVEIFIKEALDTLGQWEKVCLDASQGNTADGVFSLLFRLAHNTKGSSQSVGLKVFGSFVHEVENLIKALRDSTIPKESVLNWPEFLLESQSILTTWLEGLANGSILPEHKFPRADEHVLKIQALLKVSEVSSTPASVEGDIVFDMDVLTAHQVKSPETKSIPAASAPATASNAKPIETSLKLQPKDMEEHCEKLETTLSELQELGWNLTHNLNLDEWDPIVLKFRKIRRAMFESLEGAQQFLDQTPEVLIQRLTRATLDLGRQQGKKISIYVTGESSRIRTDLLLGMVNAFTHMVRNSVDHGIEMPDVRVAAGKPPVATLKLAFSSSGRGATIELSDDGAGLNRDKIIQTAVSKGLISHERSFELKDTEVWNLIFLPGFSTKEAVTDVSGRGVGMDVVLTAINEFSGKIDIESTAGQGTKFKVWLPSPSTTQDCLLVRADEILYALPESCTNQIVKLEKAVWIGKQSERPSIEVNKKILPVFDLIELFPLFNNGDASKIAKKSVENRAGYGVLFEKTKYPYCLKVDEIVSLENVIIKRTGNNIKKIPNVSGMTQMQNGELVYILDPEGWAEQVFNLGVGHAS